MEMELKWGAILIIGLNLAIFSSLAISEYVKYQALGQCRAAAIQQGKDADYITKVCKE